MVAEKQSNNMSFTRPASQTVIVPSKLKIWIPQTILGYSDSVSLGGTWESALLTNTDGRAIDHPLRINTQPGVP